jgi:hypothetical protein
MKTKIKVCSDVKHGESILEAMMPKATPRQLAAIWGHWQYYGKGMFDLPIEKQKKRMLEHFQVQDIREITNAHASNYIKDIPLELHSPVGFYMLRDLEDAWNVKEVDNA